MAANAPADEKKVQPPTNDTKRQDMSLNIATFLVKGIRGIDIEHKDIASVLSAMMDQFRNAGVSGVNRCGLGDILTDIETLRRGIFESKINDRDIAGAHRIATVNISRAQLRKYRNTARKKQTPTIAQLLAATRAGLGLRNGSNRTNF